MKRWIILAGLSAAAVSGSALAQQAAPAAGPRAMTADSNGDGAISRAEFMARAEARFARVDADKNGVLTREERRSARQAMRAARVERRATRAPGAENSPLAGMERMGRARGGGGGGARMLARLDGDRDGRVSLAEFQTGVAKRLQARPLPEGVTAEQRNERLTARFKRWDADADGYVDGAEIAAIGPRARRAPTPPEM
jgi:hypothetical protein